MTTTTTLSLLPFLLLLSSVKVSYSINIAEVNCNQSTATTSSDNNYNNVITDCLPLGEAFNILHGYGFLSFSIHVAPLAPFPTNHHQSKHSSSSSSNDSSAVDRTNERSSAVAVKQHMHLFHLTTHPVLDRRYFERDVRRYSRGQTERQIQIRLTLCDSVEDLIAHFLHGIKVDGLNKPWKAFTASWKKQFIPKIFGIPATFLHDDYTFVLIRIEKRSIFGSVNGTMQLEPDLLAKFLPMTNANNNNNITDDGGDLHWRPAIDFFLQFGTHVLTNYTTGDALYQVLVYNASSIVNHVELRDRLEKFRPSNASRAEWISLFSEPHPLHHGKLQLVSGNRTQVSWLESRLSLSTLPKNLPSSVRLLAAPVLFNHFYRQLQPRAVLIRCSVEQNFGALYVLFVR